MHAARLVVDVEHAAANHHRDEHRQCDRTGQQILHVFDIGVELDNIERRFLQQARLDRGLVKRVGELADFLFNRGTHEVIAVVDD